MGKRLTWVEFDYTVQVGPGNSWTYRPLIDVEISAKSSRENIRIKGMIDSGTDSTVIHSRWADALGIDRTQGQRVRLGGIGNAEGFLSNVRLMIPDMYVAMEIPAIFADVLPADALLGQRHFFQRFKIRFKKGKNKFYLTSDEQNPA